MLIKNTPVRIPRRELLAAAVFAIPGLSQAAKLISSPEISEQTSPAEQIWVETPDGNKATAILRRPPGHAKTPAIIFLHGGLRAMEVKALREASLHAPTQCRALAAGYTTLIATFRDRNVDPQSTVAFVDCLAMVRYAKKLPGVDPDSIAIYGCSGGGSLALELAGEEKLAAIVCEEPATVLFTGIMNKNSPKKGTYFTPTDPQAEMADPKKYYTPALQKFTRDKLHKITCPILIVRGDQHAINKINTDIIIPELKAQGKDVREIVFAGEPHCFGFSDKGRTEAASNLFPKLQEFLVPRLKTKPKPVAASLVREVPLKSATALFSEPVEFSCSVRV